MKHTAILLLMTLFACVKPEKLPPAEVPKPPEPRADAPQPETPDPDRPPPETPAVVPTVRKVDPTPLFKVRRQERKIFGFEDIRDFRRWEPTAGLVEIGPEREAVSDGYRAMLVKTRPSDGYPGVTLSAGRGRFFDWSGYETLAFDVQNKTDEAFNLYLRIDDDRSVDYPSRLNTSFGIPPDGRTCRLNMNNAETINGKRKMNWNRIKVFILHFDRPEREISFSLDNIRLTAEPEIIDLEEHVHLLDFGGRESLVWPGFSAVTPEDIRGEGGIGFAGKADLRPKGSDCPDPLTGDYISGGNRKDAEPIRFSVQLPAGRYGVIVYGRNSYSMGYPARSWKILAEGGTVDKLEMTAERFYSKDYFYLGLDKPYRPGANLWEQHIKPLMPRREFFVDVKDDALDLEFQHFAVAAMTICPAELQPRARYLVDETDTQRREYFHREFCRIQQKAFPGWPVELTDEDEARGYVAFSHDYLDSVTPWLAPTADQLKPSLSIAAGPGEYEPACFCVRPLTDIENARVEVSALIAGDATLPDGTVDVRIIRHKLVKKAPGVYQPVGKILEPFDSVDLPEGVTQGFWLTARIPADAAPGDYIGMVSLSAADRPSVEIPIEVTVHPFTLPPADDLNLGLYYKGPFTNNQRYSLFDETVKKGWKTVEREMLDLKAHGLNTIQLPMPGISVASGELQLDFRMLDRYASLCHKNDICSSQPAMMFTIEIANALMRAGYEEFSSEFNALYTQAHRRIVEWSQREKLPVVIWPVDEPRERMPNSWNRNYADTVRYLKLLREVAGARTTITLLSDNRASVDYVPMVDLMDFPQTKADAKSSRIVDRCRRQGKPFWIFNAGFSRASWGFMPWSIGAKGRWQWHYQWWAFPYPYSPVQRESWGLVYPSPDGPRPTVQYEWLREGIDDYRYIRRLEQAVDAAEAEGRDASTAKKLLNEIRDRLPEYAQHIHSDAANANDKTPGDLDVWRRRIAREIIRLEKK